MEKPKLIKVDLIPYGRDKFILRDPHGISPHALILDRESVMIASLMDGTRNIREIQEEFARKTGVLILSEKIEGIIRLFKENLFLEDENYMNKKKAIEESFRTQKVREPSHAGHVYPSDKTELIEYLKNIIEEQPKQPFNSLIVPHIDLERGRRTYGKGFGTVEVSNVELFLILGTSHYADTESPFILTYKDFLSPLGIASTDEEAVKFIIEKTGVDWTEGEIAHRTEHSIEFPLIFLQFLFGDIKILPVLVNSFHSYIQQKREPAENEAIRTFLTALKEVTEGKRTFGVCGADLSHVGPRFGDPEPLGIHDIERTRAFDNSFLDKVIRGEPSLLFEEMKETGDCTRICGFPPIYTLLAVIGKQKGEVIDYDYHYSTADYSLVSFASVGFRKE